MMLTIGTGTRSARRAGCRNRFRVLTACMRHDGTVAQIKADHFCDLRLKTTNEPGLVCKCDSDSVTDQLILRGNVRNEAC